MPEQLFPRSPPGVREQQAARLLEHGLAAKALADIRSRRHELPIGQLGAEVIPLVVVSGGHEADHLYIGLRYPDAAGLRTALSDLGTVDHDADRRTSNAAAGRQ